MYVKKYIQPGLNNCYIANNQFSEQKNENFQKIYVKLKEFFAIQVMRCQTFYGMAAGKNRFP